MGCRHFRYPPLGRGAQALNGAVGGGCQVVQFSCRLWSSFRCRLTEGEVLVCKSLRRDGYSSGKVEWAPTKTGKERVVPLTLWCWRP